MSSIKEKIKLDLNQVVQQETGVELKNIHLEQPAEKSHGDFASNIALANFSRLKQGDSKFSNPMELAQHIAAQFPETGYLQKVKAAAPGFINFYVRGKSFITVLEAVRAEKENYGSSNWGKGKKILLEHTSPDPIKSLHVGHLRNNFLGIAVTNLLEFSGFDVTTDCIINDRGTHVCRVMWGYLFAAFKKNNLDVKKVMEFNVSESRLKAIAEHWDWKQLLSKWVEDKSLWLKPADLNLKPDYFYLLYYALGDKAEKKIPGAKDAIRELLQAWESKDTNVRYLWEMIIKQSLAGQHQTYERIKSRHDYIWYESDLYAGGKDIVNKGLEKGVFRESRGAVVTDLAEYNLPDAVLIKSDSTSLYHTFDINLTKKKREKFPSDLYIWVIGNEQILYMKQLFAICEQLGIGSKEDYLHLYFGYVYLQGGERMQTREGTVVTADALLNDLEEKVALVMEKSGMMGRLKKSEKEEAVKKISLAAAKYGLLRYSREKDIHFNIDSSVSLEGASGPYIQYAYTRGRSILEKAGFDPEVGAESLDYAFADRQERELLRLLIEFPGIVEEAAKKYAPHLISTYLFDLAKNFNKFYERVPVLKSAKNEKTARLVLVWASAQVIENGLNLLGIGVPDKM